MIKKHIEIQKMFSQLFYDVEKMTKEQRIERHKTLCLSMQSVLAGLSDSVEYRDHRKETVKTNKQNILYETLDVYRYCLAMLNLWGFDENDLDQAYEAREHHLMTRATKTWGGWNGQPVIVVDVDDVIAKFRQHFYDWVNKNYNQNFSHESAEYYLNVPIVNENGNDLYQVFIEQGNINKLDTCKNIVDGLESLRAKGFWIHILTARPQNDLKCLNETYQWLDKFVKHYDTVQFSPEKYIAVSDLRAFKEGKVICAIDDSAKHAAEYAMHGIVCLVPRRSYNRSVLMKDNIRSFEWETDNIVEIIKWIDVDNFGSKHSHLFQKTKNEEKQNMNCSKKNSEDVLVYPVVQTKTTTEIPFFIVTDKWFKVGSTVNFIQSVDDYDSQDFFFKDFESAVNSANAYADDQHFVYQINVRIEDLLEDFLIMACSCMAAEEYFVDTYIDCDNKIINRWDPDMLEVI